MEQTSFGNNLKAIKGGALSRRGGAAGLQRPQKWKCKKHKLCSHDDNH